MEEKLSPIHPGEVLLEEFLKPLDMSQSRLALDIGVHPRRINEIVLGKRSITADTALRLARYFGNSAQFWLGLQMDYELYGRRFAWQPAGSGSQGDGGVRSLRLAEWVSMLVRFILMLTIAFLLLVMTGCQTPMADAVYMAHTWEDSNQNGQEDPGEGPLEGIQIQIIDSSGRLWRKAQTASDGNIYEFSAGGKCGQYDIYLSVPNGYKPTTPVVINTPGCEVARFGLVPLP